MNSNMLKMSAKKAQVNSVLQEVKEQKNGGTLEASKALAEKLNARTKAQLGKRKHYVYHIKDIRA